MNLTIVLAIVGALLGGAIGFFTAPNPVDADIGGVVQITVEADDDTKMQRGLIGAGIGLGAGLLLGIGLDMGRRRR